MEASVWTYLYTVLRLTLALCPATLLAAASIPTEGIPWSDFGAAMTTWCLDPKHFLCFYLVSDNGGTPGSGADTQDETQHRLETNADRRMWEANMIIPTQTFL